ncbi:hypothetical protein QJS10_CPA05g01769 [Acorus calamus]|uniref:Uncharacterized protein n=1 Tax=Acorus calamus TaxID=4465 RepID=A0AAV9F0B3_ACOCL|nr:hypothetical protein QJS10_CPA05g01769 [Acorus calamus]
MASKSASYRQGRTRFTIDGGGDGVGEPMNEECISMELGSKQEGERETSTPQQSSDVDMSTSTNKRVLGDSPRPQAEKTMYFDCLVGWGTSSTVDDE